MRFGVLASAALAGACAAVLATPGGAFAAPDCAVTDARTARTSGTLSEAVEAAKAGDTLKVQGTCYGDTKITKSLTIEGVSSSKTGPATLNGEGKNGSIVGIEAAKIVKLAGLTITGGGYTFWGAGVFTTSPLTVESDTFTSNVANRGAAIASEGASVHIVNSTFSENEVYDFGSAIDSYRGSLTVTSSRFTRNHADEGTIFAVSSQVSVSSSTFEEDSAAIEGFPGAAIATRHSTTTITKSTFKHDHAYRAGAIFGEYGKTSIVDSNVSEDTALGEGAAVGAIEQLEGELSITSSTIDGNEATGYAGALYLGHCHFAMTDSSLSHNSSESSAGAIFSEDAQLDITGSKIEDNNAEGAAGAIETIGFGGSLTIVDSELAGNSAAGAGGAIFDDETSLEVDGSTFSANDSVGADGGALYLESGSEAEGVSAQLTTTVLKQNSAMEDGGAVEVHLAPLTLSGASLEDNDARYGGGVFDAGGTVIADGSKLEGNKAREGGGLFASEPVPNFRASVTLEHSTDAKNLATADGGGAYVEAGDLDIDASTITLNQAGEEGGGIFSLGVLGLEDAAITNNKPQNCAPSAVQC